MTQPIPAPKCTFNCLEHPEKELELFCETCGVLICNECRAKHHNHLFETASEAFEKQKKELEQSLELMEEKLTTINEALLQLDKCCKEITDQKEAIESNIQDSFQQFKEILDAKKTNLIGELHCITQRKLKRAAVQRSQMEIVQAQMTSCLNLARENMNTGSEKEVLKMKTDVEKQVKELTTACLRNASESPIEADVKFTAAVCENYGQVFSSGSPDPSKCDIAGKGLVVGEKSQAIMRVVDRGGEPCKEPPWSLQCELMSELTGVVVRGSFEKKGPDRYMISYQPTVKGRHQLSIRINEKHIRGSPFAVTVKYPIDKLGTPILTIDGLNQPWGVTVSQKGEVVVAEYGKNCISILTPTGKKLRSIEPSRGQFHRIRGVSLDGEGNILVVDDHRLRKFDINGQFLKAVGALNKGPVHFHAPQDVTYNPSNQKIYVVDCNHRVQVLNADFTLSGSFGIKGSARGEFNYPRGIACDSSGKVYVADDLNNRIQVFSAEGKFLMTLGKAGMGKGELWGPVSVIVDTNNVVYISERDNERVSVFTSAGQFVTSFGSRGKGKGEFATPFGLAVDNAGVLYLCDRKNDRIQVF